MFINERNDIKEKMDKMLIQLGSESAEIQKQKDIYNKAANVIFKYDSFKTAKEILTEVIIISVCCIMIIFALCFLTLTEDAVPTFFGSSFIASLFAVYACSVPIKIIRRTKGVTEEDYNKAILDVEESKEKITKLKCKRKSLKGQIKKYESVLKSIDKLHKNINNILSAIGKEQHFACTEDLISNELIDDFNKFLNEPIDYSKASLVADSTIEEDQLKKLIMKR